MPSPSERFADRHLGPQPHDIDKMLATVGAPSLDDLIAEAVPEQLDRPLDLPPALSETGMVGRLRQLANRNQVLTSLIGLGYYDTIVPPVIQRNVLENPAWYTAYTPYQPEIAQGRLEVLLSFQTMVSDLTGMDIANASLLDEPTAAAEAVAMARRLSSGDRNVLYIDPECHLPTRAVVETRARATGVEVVDLDPTADPQRAFAVLLQYPSSSGALPDPREETARFRSADALVIVATDLLALTLLTPPGEWGADIAVGSAQRFGVPLGFGGPHAGFIATRDQHVRALPGRLVGVSKDPAGRPAYRLALQTREQHIRREKATSNVCTAQVLLAVMAGLYGCWHGPEGLKAIAGEVHRLTSRLAAGLTESGYQLANDTWFDTITVRTPGNAAEVMARADVVLYDRLVSPELLEHAPPRGAKDGLAALRAVAAEKIRQGAPLTRAEVAAFLTTTTKQLQRWEARGRIRRCPALVGLVRYAPRDVERLASASGREA